MTVVLKVDSDIAEELTPSIFRTGEMAPVEQNHNESFSE